jgi:hypothetical protein
MTQEEKELLLKDLSARLPYGVKIMVERWDSDMDCEFTTIETVIGVDDRFIYTIWDKTGEKDKHSIVEPLSILDYKPYLRPMYSLTEDEMKELAKIDMRRAMYSARHLTYHLDGKIIDYLNEHFIDWRHLIPNGLALEAKEGMYDNKE